ncbi:MAG: hypothetical protein AAFU85_25055 [Planctomycetota bacterium]
MSEHSIDLSADARTHIEGVLSDGSFRDAAHYIETLIREDLLTRQRLSAIGNQQQATLERLAREGLESGAPITVDASYWENEKRRLRENATNP